MVPWPYSFKTDMTVDQVILKLRDEIDRYDGLAGSEAELERKSFWIRRSKNSLLRSRTRLNFQYFITGSVKHKGGETVVDGWVIPGIGAIFFFLLFLAAGVRYGVVVASDPVRSRDWRVVVLCVAYVVVVALTSLMGISPEIKFLKGLVGAKKRAD